LAAAAGELETTGQVALIGENGISPADDPRLSAVAAVLRDRWPERVRDGIHALDLAGDPLRFATGLIARGDADICLAGPETSADSLEEAVRWLVGPERSSQGRGYTSYLETADGRLLTTVVPDTAGPLDAKGIAHLAFVAATHRSRVVGDQPRVGFLVVPPSRDASHADAEMALVEFRALAPGIPSAVEWQWPVPADPARFRSRPNVLIFPDPVSGHLAQLILREAGRIHSWGPMYPGGNWVIAGVPEGSEPADVMAVAALAAAGLGA
jgi:phosphotransacetylase